jgi:hypothetical protein
MGHNPKYVLLNRPGTGFTRRAPTLKLRRKRMSCEGGLDQASP